MNLDIQPFLESYRTYEGNIISLLQDIQQQYGYIPEPLVFALAEALDIPPGIFFGVATFYTQFHLHPRGKHIVTACCGTACHVKGAERLINSAERAMQVTEENPTSADGEFTLERVACLGACSLAPVFLFEGKVHGKMTRTVLGKEIERLRDADDA
ncbi:MAG TPA: NAD(P)H-dependent oxidoreductase subunit E [Dissulfurispiraceae bacterium]|nr:NAD(P)H-dependent oxidoreductase subunit E [Dissulfurispiraceae bacterium]